MANVSLKYSSLFSYDSLLDALIHITGLSRGQIKKFFPKPSKLNIKVYKGMEIAIPIDLLNYKRVNPLYAGAIPEHIFEDDSFILLNKPSGTHMHPLSYSDTNNLVSYLVSLNSSLEWINEEGWDKGFIYRLDQETSGLVYYAKSTSIYNKVRAHFGQMVKEKFYLAIVEGEIKNSHQIQHSYFQKKGAAKVQVTTEGDNPVRISIAPIAYNSAENITLIRVQLSEGKRHQIRAQMSLFGHPILGDTLYQGKVAERLFLHCEQYIFNFENKLYDIKVPAGYLFDNFFNFN